LTFQINLTVQNQTLPSPDRTEPYPTIQKLYCTVPHLTLPEHRVTPRNYATASLHQTATFCT